MVKEIKVEVPVERIVYQEVEVEKVVHKEVPVEKIVVQEKVVYVDKEVGRMRGRSRGGRAQVRARGAKAPMATASDEGNPHRMPSFLERT